MLKSIEKHTTRPTWLAEWTVYVFLRENGKGTTKYGYYGWFSTVLGDLFCLSMPIVYQVYRFALLLRPLSSVFFWRFTFSLVRVSFYYSTIIRTSASTSAYSCVQTMHVRWNTHLPSHNSAGVLAPWSYPEPALAIQTDPGHVQVFN